MGLNRNDLEIDKIKGLIKYLDCSMPKDEKEIRIREGITGYNQAIDDVVKLFALSDGSAYEDAMKALTISDDVSHSFEKECCPVCGNKALIKTTNAKETECIKCKHCFIGRVPL